MSSTDIDEAIAQFTSEGLEPSEPFSPQQPVEEPAKESEEAPAEERPRDEKGRFAPKEPEEMILGRFKSYEDLEKAYRELDSEYGRRSQEYGELKKMVEQMQAEPEKAPTPGVSPLSVSDEQIEQAVSTNPVQALEWARQNEPTGQLYDRLIEAWTLEAPHRAMQYQIASSLAQFQQQFQAQQEPLNQHIAEQTETANLTRAWQTLKAEIPDLDEQRDNLQAAAQEHPYLWDVILANENPSVEDYTKVLRTLYKLGKFEQANKTLASGQDAPATEEAPPFVASDGNAVTAETKSAGEQWLAEIGFDEAAAPYYDAGWTTTNT